MVDDDKSFGAHISQPIEITSTTTTLADLAAMTLAVQEVSSLLDEVQENASWRIDVYRKLKKYLTGGDFSGTGCEEEIEVLNALALLAQALGVF